MKFQNKRDALRWAANEFAFDLAKYSFDVVTWVPSTRSSFRHRGYEPGRLLANMIARQLDAPAVAMLTRDGSDIGQHFKGRRERMEGPAFKLRRRLPGPSVLLLDDVVTTGASLASAAKILREAGARYIRAASLAKRR